MGVAAHLRKHMHALRPPQTTWCSLARVPITHLLHSVPTCASRAFACVTKRSFAAATEKSPNMFRDHEEYFRFTRGRFVQNEVQAMAPRCVRFDVQALANIATEAVGAKQCVGIEKLLDGMYNKCLLFSMDDGAQVVAKIPNPNAGQPFFTTASEVATMDFMRNSLGIPTPQVYTWCSKADETPVGTEFIIMSKAPGILLESVWHRMSLPDRIAIIKEIARFQSVWTSVSYSGFGSIYYASDLPEKQRLRLNNSDPNSTAMGKFALGPATGRDWFDDGRQTVAFDRGPWNTLETYMRAIGQREIACIKALPHLPPAALTLCGPGTYVPTREKKVRAVEFYLQVLQHLLPSDSILGKPSAWHGDLHISNIFVDPSQPAKVTGIIDWQSTEVAPLFLQAREPPLLRYEGPQATGLERPRRVDNYAELSKEEKQAADKLQLDQTLSVIYRKWTKGTNPDIWKAFEFQDTPAHDILLMAHKVLVEGEALYSAYILDQLRSKDNVLEGFGLCIPDHIKNEIDADAEGTLRGMEAMSEIQKAMGSLFPERGCVRHDQYDEAKDGLRQCKKQIIETFATTESDRAVWEELWPFDD